MVLAQTETWMPSEPDVMEISGRLDNATGPRIEEDVYLCIQSGSRCMVLDCAELSYITSAGLRAMLVMARAMQQAGGRLAVCDLQPQVEALFMASGCHAFISAFDSRHEAIAAFAA